MRAGMTMALVGLLASGCAFGTNKVVLPATLTPEMPTAGEGLAVRVKDSRTGVAGAEVGVKRNTYGSKTGSVALANNEPVADRLTRDLVAISRTKGYRASTAAGATSSPADAVLEADISVFLVDAKMGWTITLESLAVVKLTMIDARTQQATWSDVARVDGKKSNVHAVLESDHQELVQDLYVRLLAVLRELLPPPKGR